MSVCLSYVLSFLQEVFFICRAVFVCGFVVLLAVGTCLLCLLAKRVWVGASAFATCLKLLCALKCGVAKIVTFEALNDAWWRCSQRCFVTVVGEECDVRLELCYVFVVDCYLDCVCVDFLV